MEHDWRLCQGLREGTFAFYRCITSHHNRNGRTPTCHLPIAASGPGVWAWRTRVLHSGSHQAKTLVRDRTHLRLGAFQITAWWQNCFPCYCRTRAPYAFFFLIIFYWSTVAFPRFVSSCCMGGESVIHAHLSPRF